jgi:hypothetical protein
MAGPILFWPQQVNKHVPQLDGITLMPSDRSGGVSSNLHRSADSAGLHRARQAAEQARAVAAAVTIATAAAADRAASDRAFDGTQSHAAGPSSNRRGRGSWRGTPQQLTERAILLHESQSAAWDADDKAVYWPQQLPVGSRFVPEALPFHCASDYFSPCAPGLVDIQRI